MKRSLGDYVSWKAVQHIAYLPPVIFAIKNWPDFFGNYLGFTNQLAVYNFRNGTRITTVAITDVATIMDIFFRKDYGDVKDNAIVIDIGANIGVYAIYAAKKAENVKILAFEPAPEEFKTLAKNIEINKLGNNITAFPAAVSGKDEIATLYLNGGPHNSFHDHWENVQSAQVQCLSLESVFENNKLDHCDMLKMDCEGSEFEILGSTPENIFEKIAAIRMEYHCPPGAPMTPDELVAFLAKKGYHIVKKEAATDGRGIIWAERT